MWQSLVGYGDLMRDEVVPTAPDGAQRPSSALLQYASMRKMKEGAATRVSTTSADVSKNAVSAQADGATACRVSVETSRLAGLPLDPSVEAGDVYIRLVANAPDRRLTLAAAEEYWVQYTQENGPMLSSSLVSERMHAMAMKGMAARLQQRLREAEAEAKRLWAVAEAPPAVNKTLQEQLDLLADYCEEIEGDDEVSAEEKKQAAEQWEAMLARMAAEEDEAGRRVEELRRNALAADARVDHIRMLIAEHATVRVRRRPRAVPVASWFQHDQPAPSEALPKGSGVSDHSVYQTWEALMQYSDREQRSREASEARILEAKRQGTMAWDTSGEEILREDEVGRTQTLCREAMAAVELLPHEFERLYLFISRE